MTKVVLLVSHSGLAEGMKQAAEFIIGEQKNFYAIGLYEEGIEPYRQRISNIVTGLKHEASEIIIISDIPAGSPGINAFLAASRSEIKVRLISGMNLALILDILLTRDRKDIDSLIRDSMRTCKDSISEQLFPVTEDVTF